MTLLLLAPAFGELITLLLYLVVFLIIIGLIFWATTRLCAAFSIVEPARTVILVVLVIIVVLAFLAFFLPLIGRLP